MADFTFAIVVPLASPIQPVATSTHDRGHVTTAHLIGAGGVQDFKMIPIEPDVNSSMENYVTPPVWRVSCPMPYNPASISRHQSFGDATQQTTCAGHNSPIRACIFASVALNSPHRSRPDSSGEAALSWFAALGSIALFAHI